MYQIEMLVDGRWCALGGLYQGKDEAQKKIEQFRLCGSSKAPKFFRILRVS